MTYAARVDENGLLTLPLELCEHLGLQAHLEVELEETGNRIKLTPKHPCELGERRSAAVPKNTEQYLGLQRTQFLAEGWNSVDEYIADMRGR